LASRPDPSRRFLPSDPRVEEPYLLTPQLAFRVAILGFVALALFSVLFLRLWALQVLSGDTYENQASDNRVRERLTDAPRGAIIDRNNRVLVRNVQGTSIEVWPADLPKGPAARERVLRHLAMVVDMPLRELQARIRAGAKDPLTPVLVRRGVHDDQIHYIEEHERQLPGVELVDSYLRKYPHRSLGAHILGHVGEISPDQVKAMKRDGYRAGDWIGQAGVEATYDTYLRGRPGSDEFTVDSLGRQTSPLQQNVIPKPGSTVRLTIDIELQRAAEQALRDGIAYAHEAGGTGWAANGGAVVALDPSDGAVLALASYPTFEPSVYVSRDPRKLAKLQNDAKAREENYPGLNRALAVGYPPGSTWKPVTALAAMQEHILTPYAARLCSPTYTAYEQTFKNWTPLVNNWMELPAALANSCDTYFYQVGRDFYELPEDRGHPLQNWASRFGFGATTGIDVGPEEPGLIPTPEWRREHFSGPNYTEIHRTWKPGYSIQMAIGQGDLVVTPIQMARFYAMIANGGLLVTPHIVEDVERGDPRSPHVEQRFTPPPPTSTGVDPAALAIVRTGLYEATHSAIGTSSGVFGSFPVDIAGKTGTAEKLISLPGYPQRLMLDQSWWCGYGPTDNPSIVVCVVIENGGHGGSAAAPAALQVFEEWFDEEGAITAHPSD
jgi:penicillin-binding protein 2